MFQKVFQNRLGSDEKIHADLFFKIRRLFIEIRRELMKIRRLFRVS